MLKNMFQTVDDAGLITAIADRRAHIKRERAQNDPDPPLILIAERPVMSRSGL